MGRIEGMPQTVVWLWLTTCFSFELNHSNLFLTDVKCQLSGSGWAAHLCRLRRRHCSMFQPFYSAVRHDSSEDALSRCRRRQRSFYQSHGLASGQCQISRHGSTHLWRDEPQGGLRLQRSQPLFVGHHRHPKGFQKLCLLVSLRLPLVL